MAIDIIRDEIWLEHYGSQTTAGEGSSKQIGFLYEGTKFWPHPDGYHAFLTLHVEDLTPTIDPEDEGVLGYSAQLYIKTSYLRAAGKYKDPRAKSAEAVIDEVNTSSAGGPPPGYSLHIFSRNLTDLKKLYELIRTGEITPYKSYETEQVQPVTGRLLRLIERFGRFERRVRRVFGQRLSPSAV